MVRVTVNNFSVLEVDAELNKFIVQRERYSIIKLLILRFQ